MIKIILILAALYIAIIYSLLRASSRCERALEKNLHNKNKIDN